MKKINLAIIDKYISKQLLETFLLGITVFTALIFASDQFLYLIKQISTYGIPIEIAFKTIVLQLPYIIVFIIPMSILLATILTFNKLSTSSELIIMRACGINLVRLAMPALIFGVILSVFSFCLNEFIVPQANIKSRNLMVQAITQKNLPEGKTNFSFKELDENKQLKRLFYINKYQNQKLEGITVLDLSRQGVIQTIQAKYGETTPESWRFNNGVIYTISEQGKILNTLTFDVFDLYTDFNLSNLNKDYRAKELDLFALNDYIKKMEKIQGKNIVELKIKLHEKIALPITAFVLVVIAIPLAINPPRSTRNRGLLFSIGILFCYYVLRAVATSLGEALVINEFLAAWLPNILIFSSGLYLFYRKAYKV